MSLLHPSRRDITLPPWRTIAQSFTKKPVDDLEHVIRDQLTRPAVRSLVPVGTRVALAVGSRGISRIDDIVRHMVTVLREFGAEPFVVPAMGSHGGATAQGQTQMLASLGVTAESVGAPIRSGMEAELVGHVLGNVAVYTDKLALTEADIIVPISRVKPHTDFRGTLESGLAKMLAIGLGNHQGATSLHSVSFSRFGELVPAASSLVRAHARVPFGIAIVEDGYHQPAIVEAVLGDEMERREKELLSLASEWLPRLPFTHADVLVVQELGKNISGTGMDANVTGRFAVADVDTAMEVSMLVVLDLSPGSHGNASGIGMADLTTRRAADKIDWTATYTNQVTSGVLAGAKLPLVAASDREALDIAARCVPGVPTDQLRIAWIMNTLELTTLRVSEPLWADIATVPNVIAVSDPEEVRFTNDGTLTTS